MKNNLRTDAGYRHRYYCLRRMPSHRKERRTGFGTWDAAAFIQI